MKTNSKDVIRLIGFLAVFILIFSYCSKVFSKKWDNKVRASIMYYSQPKGSIDVLFLGASGIRWGVSPLTIWDEIGMTSYVRGIGGQQAPMTYYYFLESLTYQTPKLVVLDAYRLVRYYPPDENEASYRRSYEPMKMSLIKMKAYFDITKNGKLDMKMSFLFPFFRYHTRWKELEREDFTIFTTESDDFRGQGISFDIYPAELSEDFMIETKARTSMKEESLYYYEKIIEICKENNIDVFLLSMPRLSRADYAEYLVVKDFAEQHQLLFVDYNLPELLAEVGFDQEIDMKDEGHLNSCGAEKFSRHLALYLQDNFDLPDRRQEPIAEQWNLDAEILQSEISEHCQ